MKKYAIYQIEGDDRNGLSFKFMPLHFVKSRHLCTMDGDKCRLDKGLYKKVYEGLYPDTTEGTNEILENLFVKFQGEKPVGYIGHSLSVSDVVELDGTAHYVDSFGFEEIKF